MGLVRIAVIALVIVGIWVHEKRSEPPAVSDGIQATIAGGSAWLPYVPAGGMARGTEAKVRLAGVRLLGT